jgi:methionine-S-sulfoxide reductase
MKATFAAGCFWGVEAFFKKLPGVIDTEVGYIGGHTKNPTYEEVCRTDSGHAEAIEIEFDPDSISFTELLESFFKMHDPTQLNRQGPDVGDQYRSAIFYHSDEQKQEAEQYMAKLTAENRFSKPVVTRLELATTFFTAEDYHQDYLDKGGQCHL